MVVRIDELHAVPFHRIDGTGQAARGADDQRLAADVPGELGVAADDGGLRDGEGGHEEEPEPHAVILSRTPKEASRAFTNSTGNPMIVEMGRW
ncbi:MAG: hypothetical protein RI910_2743 [Verrucomicrobiota bacterium]